MPAGPYRDQFHALQAGATIARRLKKKRLEALKIRDIPSYLAYLEANSAGTGCDVSVDPHRA